ncbi:MAG: hypothetical protein V2G42_06315 [bacterium JZ-2024 1]
MATILYYGLGWVIRVTGKLFYFVLTAVLVILLWLQYSGKL